MNAHEQNSGRVKFFDEHMENYDQENSALHRKLQSKIEALKIMRKELEQFRTERDQFKLMAETLQLRYSAMKKSLHTDNNFECSTVVGSGDRSKVGALLSETRGQNIALNTEVENLRQKVLEMQGDIEALRNEKITLLERRSTPKPGGCGGVLQEMEKQWNEERSKYIFQLETLKKKSAQLQYDFRALLDEKEEIVTERDAYKCKVHRLNHELNIALKGEEAQVKVLDIDALVLENKYLQERLKNMENELEMAQQSASKYKAMLDTKRKKGIIKLGSNSSEIIMSHKQVKNLLERGSAAEMPLNAATIADLKSLCLTLLDNLNDKNLAYLSQKKANKILAERLSELENRIQTLIGTTGDDHKTSLLSPSELLLRGYTSSTVDQEQPTQNTIIDDDSGTASSEGSKTISHDLDQFSATESNKSLASSELDVQTETSSEYTNTIENSIVVGGETMASNIEQLTELPPELAALVEKALRESNMIDTEHDDADKMIVQQQ